MSVSPSVGSGSSSPSPPMFGGGSMLGHERAAYATAARLGGRRRRRRRSTTRESHLLRVADDAAVAALHRELPQRVARAAIGEHPAVPVARERGALDRGARGSPSPSASALRPTTRFRLPVTNASGEAADVRAARFERLLRLAARLERARARRDEILLVDRVDHRELAPQLLRLARATAWLPARAPASRAPRRGARRAGSGASAGRDRRATANASSTAASAASGRSAAISTIASTSYASAWRHPAASSPAISIALLRVRARVVEPADRAERDREVPVRAHRGDAARRRAAERGAVVLHRHARIGEAHREVAERHRDGHAPRAVLEPLGDVLGEAQGRRRLLHAVEPQLELRARQVHVELLAEPGAARRGRERARREAELGLGVVARGRRSSRGWRARSRGAPRRAGSTTTARSGATPRARARDRPARSRGTRGAGAPRASGRSASAPVRTDSSHATMNGASSAAARRSRSCAAAVTEIASAAGGTERRALSSEGPDGGARTDWGARVEGGGPPPPGVGAGNPLGIRGADGGPCGGEGGPPLGGGGSVGMKARRAMDRKLSRNSQKRLVRK